MRKLSKKTLAVATTVVLLSGGGAAFAYWTAGGTGTGTAATATSATVSVNQTGAVITGLTPGGPFFDLAGTLTNSTTGPLLVASVTAAVTGVDASHPTCAFTDYKITGTSVLANLDTSGYVPVGSTATWSGLKVNLANTAANQNACKGATVTITYASS